MSLKLLLMVSHYSYISSQSNAYSPLNWQFGHQLVIPVTPDKTHSCWTEYLYMKQLTYFHLVFMTRGWLHITANHYSFQTKLREEERETAELDCPWPMTQTDNSAVTYVLVIWEAAEGISEMRHSIQLKLHLVHGFFFSTSWKEIWLEKGGGGRQIPKRTVSTFPWIRLIYQLENLSLEEGSSSGQNLDSGFNHTLYYFT